MWDPCDQTNQSIQSKEKHTWVTGTKYIPRAWRHTFMKSDRRSFSSPEPVVSWSRGQLQIEPSGSGDENGLENRCYVMYAKRIIYRFEEENWVPVNFRGAIVARRFRNMASFVLLLWHFFASFWSKNKLNHAREGKRCLGCAPANAKEPWMFYMVSTIFISFNN